MTLTPQQQEILRSQPINNDGPGTVLHDFDVLLRFLGTEGVATAGELRLLPIKSLPELNAAMHEPLRVDLPRGQVKSYPNLAALLMLGRASGLVMLKAVGDETRLALDGDLLHQWLDFNPVERYCTLLDAWAFHVDPVVLGEHAGRFDTPLGRGIETWRRVPKNGRAYSNQKRASAEGFKDLCYERYPLAFLWLFGLLEIEQGKPLPRKAWCPAAVRHTPFGDALLTLFAHAGLLRPAALEMLDIIFGVASDEEEEDVPEHGNGENTSIGESQGEHSGAQSLDKLQPVLKPYFPQWERTLTIPPPEFRDGVYIFKAVLRGLKVLRRVAVPARSTWDDFGDAIRRSVNFDDEHLWAFTYTDRFGGKIEITRGVASESGLSGAETRIGDLPLREREPFPFVYDFGDCWTFEVTLERIDPPDSKRKSPKVIEKQGRSPKQYPDWD